MIDITKQYRTRDGREVRIYATDGTDDQNVHGAVKDSDGWNLAAWYSDGVYARSDRNGPRDLIEVRPRHKRVVWLNVYDDDVVAHNSELATKTNGVLRGTGVVGEFKKLERIACLRVELDFAEGDGL